MSAVRPGRRCMCSTVGEPDHDKDDQPQVSMSDTHTRALHPSYPDSSICVAKGPHRRNAAMRSGCPAWSVVRDVSLDPVCADDTGGCEGKKETMLIGQHDQDSSACLSISVYYARLPSICEVGQCSEYIQRGRMHQHSPARSSSSHSPPSVIVQQQMKAGRCRGVSRSTHPRAQHRQRRLRRWLVLRSVFAGPPIQRMRFGLAQTFFTRFCPFYAIGHGYRAG